jgi:hypothetical protein
LELATCAELPQLDQDTRCLLAALLARGVAARAAVWSDAAIDWSEFDLVIVRSCWDYARRREEFLRWARGVPNLANDARTLGWNTHKQYLSELAASGIPVVPTLWLRPGDSCSMPQEGEWVIKPAVSLAGLDTGRYRLYEQHDRTLAVAHAERLLTAGRSIMLQPYLKQIDRLGERSLVFLGGEFSHAVCKSALLSGPDQGLDRRFLATGGMQLREHVPSQVELALAKRVVRYASADPRDLLYARVDLVPDSDQQPLLMELELTEPQLYLTSNGAAERFATLIACRAEVHRQALRVSSSLTRRHWSRDSIV